MVLGLLYSLQDAVLNCPGSFRSQPGFVEGTSWKIFGEENLTLLAFGTRLLGRESRNERELR
jgi:hypothetical protein